MKIKINFNKYKSILYFLFFILVIISIIFFYFVNLYNEKEDVRKKIDIQPILKVEEKRFNFKKNHIEIINKRLIKEKNNFAYEVENVLKGEDYKKIMNFNKKFIKEINNNFFHELEIKDNSYCEIVVNTKKRIYDFIDCYPNHIFQRYVALAIEKFNENFSGYKDIDNINTKIKIIYYYNKEEKK
tara:strand:+ start:61794 stop:62348 length:555 start_codon:yes stop_codon:yes gene_type:complete